MPKVEKVADDANVIFPLRITRRKGRRTSLHTVKSPRIHIKCGCCTEVVDIYPDHEVATDTHSSTLEINGVMGTIDQWRKVFAPLLGFETSQIISEDGPKSTWTSTLKE